MENGQNSMTNEEKVGVLSREVQRLTQVLNGQERVIEAMKEQTLTRREQVALHFLPRSYASKEIMLNALSQADTFLELSQ